MKDKKLMFTGATLAIVTALGITGCSAALDTNVSQAAASDYVSPTLPETSPDLMAGPPAEGSDAWVAWYALMGPDGEYAAAAMYQSVIDEFGDVEPYVTIKNSEERHIGALIRQLERYGVEVPENPYLGNVSAPEDLLTAARAWAEGEIANLEMYDELLAMTDDANLERVLTNLPRASEESHLPLFELAADNGGTSSPDQMPSHQGQGGGQSAGKHEDEHAGQAIQPQMRGEARGPGQHQ